MNEPVHLSASAPSEVGGHTARSFEDLVDAEKAGLFGALCLITRDRYEAEDVMQDAFLKVWEHWGRVGDMDDPTGYLYRTALNLYHKRVRRASLALKRAMRLAPRGDELGQVEAHDVVIRALAALTPRQRQSIVMVDLLDFSSEDAGRVMGIKAATVRVLASQARAVLKRNVGDADA
jgi:RNA polymerase sigma-70 factor, ECF subfamily